MREILAFVGDKWSVIAVVVLADEVLRFNELHRRVDGISQRMLARTLKGLERDGLVVRSVAPSVPPSVSYGLTRLGKTLLPPMDALARWAGSSATEIAEARARYDSATRKADENRVSMM